MNARRAVLHIGTEKTGSTSIQAALVAAREALAGSGVWYARVPGERVHDGLAAYARLPGGARGTWARQTAGEDLPAAIGAELAALPAAIHTVVYSSEQLNSRLANPDAVTRLHALLAPHFSAFGVIAYLRRQDRRAVSSYTTRLRHGHAGEDVLPVDPAWRARLDYAALLDRWAAVFGAEALLPLVFEAAAGDVVRDFWRATALDVPPPADPPRRNASLAAPAQEFLRRVNAAALATGAKRDAVQRLDRALAPALAPFAGGGRLPSRAPARAFLAAFATSNARLRERWFPKLPAVFDDRFDAYPETVEPIDESAVAAIGVAIAARQFSRGGGGQATQPGRSRSRVSSP